MALYVLKTYDPCGRLIGRLEFQAVRDEEAVAAQKALGENRWCELWCGYRMVRVWDGAFTLSSRDRVLQNADLGTYAPLL